MINVAGLSDEEFETPALKKLSKHEKNRYFNIPIEKHKGKEVIKANPSGMHSTNLRCTCILIDEGGKE